MKYYVLCEYLKITPFNNNFKKLIKNNFENIK